MKGLIFTWLLTLLGASSCIITPFYGFLAYVALAILRPDFLWSSHISGGRFSLIVASAMLLSWTWHAFGNWRLGAARRIVLLFAGFWLWSVFLAVQAPSQPHAWYFVEQMARILLPFLVGITTVRNIADLRRLAWVMVLCEGYVAFEMNAWYFSGYNYLWHIGFGGVDNNSAAIGLVTALGVAFFLFLNETVRWKQAVVAGCAAFIGHAILFSFSRGAMLATLVFAGVSFFIIHKTTKHYVMFGVGLLAAILLAGPEVQQRFLQTFEQKAGVREASAQSRLDLWKNCFTLLMRDPIMGCGPDHWPLHAHEFGWPKGKEAHSLWVQTATETGIPGIMMFLGFYLLTIWRCWRILGQLRPEDPPWFGDACRMTIASLCGFIVAAMFVSLEALEIPYYVALLGAGTMVVYGQYRQTQAVLEGVVHADGSQPDDDVVHPSSDAPTFPGPLPPWPAAAAERPAYATWPPLPDAPPAVQPDWRDQLGTPAVLTAAATNRSTAWADPSDPANNPEAACLIMN